MSHCPASVVIFFDQQGRILIQDRKTISKRGEEWGFFGGSIEDGETPKEAAIREIYEELTYKLESCEYIGPVTTNEDGLYSMVKHVFISRLPDSLTEFKQAEGDNMALFHLDDARKLKMGSDDGKILDLVKARLRQE